MIELRPIHYKTATGVLAALAAAAFLVSCGGNDSPPQQAVAGPQPQVRQIERLNSTIAADILEQVNVVPFTLQQDSPILLQGNAMPSLSQSHQEELKATYRAGHIIVLLDATMEHVAALHGIIEAGVTYSSKDGEGVLAYSLRQENRIPKATLLSKVHPSPLRTSQGDADPTGLQDEKQAYKRAADLTVSELRHRPDVSVRQPRDPNQNVDWKTSPVQQTTFQQNGAAGVYNTTVHVYALHSCEKDTRAPYLTSDYYMVTALADWTATNAKFQSAATTQGRTSMYYDATKDEYVVANWRDDSQRTFCSSQAISSGQANTCRYINYPL